MEGKKPLEGLNLLTVFRDLVMKTYNNIEIETSLKTAFLKNNVNEVAILFLIKNLIETYGDPLKPGYLKIKKSEFEKFFHSTQRQSIKYRLETIRELFKDEIEIESSYFVNKEIKNECPYFDSSSVLCYQFYDKKWFENLTQIFTAISKLNDLNLLTKQKSKNKTKDFYLVDLNERIKDGLKTYRSLKYFTKSHFLKSLEKAKVQIENKESSDFSLVDFSSLEPFGISQISVLENIDASLITPSQLNRFIHEYQDKVLHSKGEIKPCLETFLAHLKMDLGV